VRYASFVAQHVDPVAKTLEVFRREPFDAIEIASADPSD